MHMKYFQSIADIEDHYNNVEREFISGKPHNLSLLDTWNIAPEDRAAMLEEREVLRYIIGCQLNFTRDTDAVKPSLELVNRTFDRHLAFLESVHQCNAQNVNKYPNSLTRKEYKACRHYLFQFSLSGWYKKMPDVIQSFENKYPNVANEGGIQI